MELNEAARRIFGTHLRLIVAWVLFGFLAAALLHAGNERTYTATTRLVLDTPDARDRSDSTAIADMAKAIATSPSLVRGALDDAHITTRNPVDVARHHVSVTALGSSGVLDLSVSDPNRRVAAAVANTLAARVIQTRLKVSSGQLQQVLTELDGRIATLNRRIGDLDVKIASLGLTNAQARDAAQRSRDFLAQARSVLEAERVSLLSTDAQRPNPAIISQASLPTHADSSRLLQDLVLGALLGLVLGIGSAALIETVRPTFVGGDVLARELDTPLLGALSSEPGERQRQRLVSIIAARLHLAAEGAGVHDIVLLGAGTDMELRGLAERLEAVPAEALRAVPDDTELAPAATADAQGGTRTRNAADHSAARRSERRRSCPAGHAHKGVRHSHLFGRWTEWGRYRPGLAEYSREVETRRRPSSAERDPLASAWFDHVRRATPRPKRPTKRDRPTFGRISDCEEWRGAREEWRGASGNVGEGRRCPLEEPAESCPAQLRGRCPVISRWELEFSSPSPLRAQSAHSPSEGTRFELRTTPNKGLPAHP